MSIKTAINYYKSEFNLPTTNLLLVFLLGIDVVFLSLNVYNTLIPDEKWSPRLALVNDDSFSEMFQYLKWFLISTILVFTAIKKNKSGYIAWALLFAYFLFDDALQIHEKAGEYFALHVSGNAPYQLRMQDLGEIGFSAIIAVFLFSILGWAYLKGGDSFKKISRDLILLVTALIFFGVVIDNISEMMKLDALEKFISGNIEDGGEMIVASLMLWYTTYIYLADKDSDGSLVDSLKILFGKKAEHQR